MPSRRGSAPPIQPWRVRTIACTPLVCSFTHNRVPQRAQPGRQRGDVGLRLELGRTVAAAEVRQRDRRLRIESPVEHAEQRLRDVVDDGASARRAHDHVDATRRIVDDRRRHRRARSLARLDAIGDRLAVDHRREGKIGQLVVQQKPALRHQAAAERVLDRRRHRHGVAVTVDDGNVRRRRQLELRTGAAGDAARLARTRRRIARHGAPEAPVGADLARSLRADIDRRAVRRAPRRSPDRPRRRRGRRTRDGPPRS